MIISLACCKKKCVIRSCWRRRAHLLELWTNVYSQVLILRCRAFETGSTLPFLPVLTLETLSGHGDERPFGGPLYLYVRATQRALGAKQLQEAFLINNKLPLCLHKRSPKNSCKRNNKTPFLMSKCSDRKQAFFFFKYKTYFFVIKSKCMYFWCAGDTAKVVLDPSLRTGIPQVPASQVYRL